MKRIPEKKYINIGFIIALIILTSVNIVIYLNIRIHFEDEDIVNRSLKIIQLSEALYSNIIEAETNRRGYLITGNPEFMKEYYPALGSVDSSYTQLKNILYSDEEKRLIDTIQILIFNRRDLMEESLELQEQRSKDIKAQIEFTKKGKIVVDKIKLLIDKIQSEEKTILQRRLIDADRSSSYTLANLVLGNVIAFSLLILAFFLLNRSINRRRETETILEENRNWLATTLESIGDAVIVASNIGEMRFINRAAEKITGWKSEEARGLLLDHIFDIYDEDSRERLPNPFQKVISNKPDSDLSNHTLLKTKTESLVPIDYSAAPIIDSDNKVIGAVLVFRNISERRKAERELLNSQNFIKRIADTLPCVLYIYNIAGPKITYTNYKVSELLGYSADYVVNMGQRFFETNIHPEDYQKLRSAFQKYAAAKDSDIMDYEYRIRNSSGEWKWLRSYDVVFNRDKEGNVVEILGSAFDVTERKKLEDEIQKYSGHLEELVEIRTKELRASNLKLKGEINQRAKAERSIIDAEEKFRSLVENALVGIYILQDERFKYVNPKFEEIFGYGSGEMSGMRSSEVINDVFVWEVNENNVKKANNEFDRIQYSLKAVKKDGTVIDVEVKGTKMIYSGRISIIGTLQDITVRLKAEEELRKQKEFLRTVIDTDPNFVFAKDWDGRFTLANKAVAVNYGTSTEGLIGKTDEDFNNNSEEVQKFLADDREVMNSGGSKFISEEMVTNSNTGEVRWYQTIKVPLLSAEGSVQVLGVAADITARKFAEEITKKSLKEKELLLKEIHHRVKNNLQIIISLLKLQSRFVFDNRDLDIFNKSRSRVETMALIHEKLYKSSDIGEIDIGNYLTDLVNHLLKAYNINKEEISYAISADSIFMGIDTAIPCGLIINELINNIMKHAFPEGHKGKIEITISREDEEIVLQVKDNGTGLPETFDSGNSDTLGMQLIDTLIKQLEGKVEIETNEGTSFKISFKEIKYRERI